MIQSQQFTPSRIKAEWFSNFRADLLSGLVVALALIPEAIAFSIIAGVDPKVGLYASFSIAIITSFTGGRPAMISAATGAMALLMVHLVKDYGLEYLFATTILTGIIQILFGVFRLGRYMKFVPKAVMIGFVNALAILIFQAQLEHFIGESWLIYPMVAAGLAIIYLFPRLTKVIPSPLVAIFAITLFTIFTKSPLRTVGDMGELPSTLPSFLIPNVPFTLETLTIILPYAIPLALVGLIESLLTATIVDTMTDTLSNKNREAKGQGIANIITGFFGGMAGCAMIGQSVINVSSGGRTRLSTLAAGVFLLIFILFLSPILRVIPMAALVAVMFMVSLNTFDWRSLPNLIIHPKSESIVMLATVGTVLMTHNLAWGVMVGVVLSCVFFTRKIAKLISVTSELDETGQQRTYHVIGQLFFVSTEEFFTHFDFSESLDEVVIDLHHAHLWDGTAIDAIDKIVFKFRKNHTTVRFQGLNDASSTLMTKLAVHDRPGTQLSGH
ncbi:MAG: SulP family inorganic anion transporter [Trueperaceae bacterium]|nr:SulP family inorganic anion transporter [Trueperaceae bacterium]